MLRCRNKQKPHVALGAHALVLALWFISGVSFFSLTFFWTIAMGHSIRIFEAMIWYYPPWNIVKYIYILNFLFPPSPPPLPTKFDYNNTEVQRVRQFTEPHTGCVALARFWTSGLIFLYLSEKKKWPWSLVGCWRVECGMVVWNFVVFLTYSYYSYLNSIFYNYSQIHI